MMGRLQQKTSRITFFLRDNYKQSFQDYRVFMVHRADSFENRIINSRLFKFIVGETSDGAPTTFSIHEEAIARLSKPLESLVKSNLIESRAGCVVWKDVSKEMFERLVQVAYTGDYSVPSTIPWNSITNLKVGNSSEPKEIELEDEKLADKFDSGGELQRSSIPNGKAIKLKKAHMQPKSRPYAQRKGEEFTGLQPPPFLGPFIDHTCEPVKVFEPDRSYCHVFLVHASLFVFGDLWLIDPLKTLALHKLNKTLCIFKLDDKNITDIISLIRFAYTDEGKGLEEGIGRLRTIICQYTVANVVIISSHTLFMDLLAEGGQFVKDFFQFAVQRMV
jgi:hypothetical protein